MDSSSLPHEVRRERTSRLVKNGEHLALQALKPEQHFTKPPARFNEASLIKTLEKEGIGRPSTYAAIVSTILARKYVEKRPLSLFPSHGNRHAGQ